MTLAYLCGRGESPGKIFRVRFDLTSIIGNLCFFHFGAHGARVCGAGCTCDFIFSSLSLTMCWCWSWNIFCHRARGRCERDRVRASWPAAECHMSSGALRLQLIKICLLLLDSDSRRQRRRLPLAARTSPASERVAHIEIFSRRASNAPF